MTAGLNCMLTIFNKKHRIFRNTEFPENNYSQLWRSTELMKAKKSQQSIMADPTSPLLMINIKLVLSAVINLIFLYSVLSIVYNSKSNLSTLRYPNAAITKLIVKRIPLMTIQSLTMQLYPRLKSVFYRLLPSPSEMTNQSMKLMNCIAYIQ